MSLESLSFVEAGFDPGEALQVGSAASAESFQVSQNGAKKQPSTPATTAADGVWARVRAATLARSGLYTGLAGSAVLGCVAVLVSSVHVQWPGLALTLACATTLGLYSRRPVTTVERLALGIPAVSLIAVSCVLAQQGNQPMRLAALVALLAATVSFAAIGIAHRASQPGTRWQTLLAYMAYLSTAALIPLALWVVGGYGRLGIA